MWLLENQQWKLKPVRLSAFKTFRSKFRSWKQKAVYATRLYFRKHGPCQSSIIDVAELMTYYMLHKLLKIVFFTAYFYQPIYIMPS